MAVWKSRVSLPGIVGSNCTAAAALIVLSMHPASERDAPSSSAWMMPILFRTKRDSKSSTEWHLREISRKKGVNVAKLQRIRRHHIDARHYRATTNVFNKAFLAAQPSSERGGKPLFSIEP